jgi:hypothetical protein
MHVTVKAEKENVILGPPFAEKRVKQCLSALSNFCMFLWPDLIAALIKSKLKIMFYYLHGVHRPSFCSTLLPTWDINFAPS